MQGGDDKAAFQKLVDAIKASKSGKTIGVFAKDAFPGPFMTAWKAVLEKEKFTQVSSTLYLVSGEKNKSLLLIKNTKVQILFGSQMYLLMYNLRILTNCVICLTVRLD